MSALIQDRSDVKLAFTSSIREDVWHQKKGERAYECWHFDALSDDGSEAVVINFMDNSVFSPRYNAKLNFAGAKPQSIDSESPSFKRFPTVFFAYYTGGKTVYRAFNEFSDVDFCAHTESPGCEIGESSIKFDSAPYGAGFSVLINAALSRGRRLEARFEWLSIESDFFSERSFYHEAMHCWNIVAPRSDVSGRITIFDRSGGQQDVRHFRGTGYHDHQIDDRWLAETVSEQHWGRAHFADTTAIFQRYCETGGSAPCSKLFLVRDGRLHERDAEYEEQNFVRDKFGIKYPTRLRFVTDDQIRLRIKSLKVLDSSFYALRFASEMTLTLRDGKPRKTIGITELMAPKTLKYRWLDWLADVRIGKNGRGPLI